MVDIVGLNLPAAQAIFQQSTFLPAIVGTRTFRIKRIKGLNQVGANTLIHIATAAGDVIPPLQTFDGLNFDFVEADLPEVEIDADLLAWVVAATVTVQVEVEELG
ncbi:unnamed protein product [marine sediment metagenome]|uniref:Uncharacterized protein n=1 Tax=marine sediment metagenome TaxID=412755 RepID=X1FVB4_9ZZZZ